MFRRVIVLSTAIVAGFGLIALPADAAPIPGRMGEVPERTSITLIHGPSGAVIGTANQHESRPSLSLIKLYIADYVFDHGAPDEQARAYRMLQDSDDATASDLYSRYPDAIEAAAAKYGLEDTHAAAHWGESTTSTYDVAAFLEARKRDHGAADPILTALATAAPVAADGYSQDYGTAELPEVIGTKWGWSDDRASLHASASYGLDFSVSAHTYGPAGQLTDDVANAFGPAQPPAPGVVEEVADAAHDTVDAVAGSSDAASEGAARAHQAISDAANALNNLR